MEQASDVSGDGSVIVGSMNDVNISYAWRWTQGSGIHQVIGIGGGGFGPFISSDASTIVGTADTLSLSAVRWTQSTGAQPLGPVFGLPLGDGGALVGYGVSANGSVVVGSGRALYSLSPPLETFVPFRWTQPTGSVGILENGQFYNPLSGTIATDVSADGAAMVGMVGVGSFIWTAQTGYQLLTSTIPPAGLGQPRISGDATTVVYKENLWTLSTGVRPLRDVLLEAGCDIAGWTNLIGTDVSFNGLTIVGYGTNPQGQTEAWYATIPSPSVPLALGLGCFGWISRRRSSGSR